MRILVDVDGVCADFVGGLLDGVFGTLTPDDVDRWDIFSLMTPSEASYAKELLTRGYFWRGLEPIEGALEAVEELRGSGHEIVWVTSPWEACKTWHHERREWIVDEMYAEGEAIVFTSAKHLIVGDVLIDDKLDNVAAWADERHAEGRYWPLPFLFDAPYNRGLEWNGPRGNWADALDMIRKCP